MDAPIAGWGGLAFNQSMNWMYRETPLPLLVAPPSFVFPGVGAMEDMPAPDVPAEINMNVRRLWVLGIGEIARNRDSIVDAVEQCISWIREIL
ncbi:MAG: hypothetical protein IIA10_01010 [Proteobacteria bacterium]|nr:hypothetical protein [Pseudomonadota bacterium]